MAVMRLAGTRALAHDDADFARVLAAGAADLLAIAAQTGERPSPVPP